MNFSNLVSNQTSLVHLIFSILALVFGTMVLYKTKGTQSHKRIGYLYSFSMTMVLVTSFMMYNLYGKFGIFHWLAVVSSVTLLGGILPMILKRPKNYISYHFSFMYWSVMGLYAALAAEIIVRIPKAIATESHIDPMFYSLVGVAVFIVMGFAQYGFKKKKEEWSKFDPFNQ